MLLTYNLLNLYQKLAGIQNSGFDFLDEPILKAVKAPKSCPWLHYAWGNVTEPNIKIIKKFFQDMPFVWFLNEEEKHLSGTLTSNNLQQTISVPIMELDILSFKPAIMQDSMRIGKVQNKRMLDDWVNVASTAFNMNYEALESFILPLLMLDDGSVEAYLGYLENKPVATSLINYEEHVSGIYFVAVLEEYRRRGMGKLITQAFTYRPRNDLRTATLHAFKPADKLYITMGFKTIRELDCYMNAA